MAMVQTKRLAALLLALLLTLFLLPSALADSGVVSGTTVSGTVRVYLSSISSLTAVDVSIAGSYSVGGDTSRALSRGQNIRVSNSGGTLMMTANGQTQTMGSRFKLRRHQTSGENGVRIAQARYPASLYPGDIEFIAKGGNVQIVVHVYMEDYMLGVLPYEMDNSFPLEALKAQAVAARTYALKKMSVQAATYDVVDTTSDQVYNGTPSGNARCAQAVQETSGIVGTVGGEYMASYYTASNGGQTESVKNAWGSGSYSYLQVKDDPYDLRNGASIAKSVTFYRNGTTSVSALTELLRTEAAMLVGAGSVEIASINGVTLAEPKYGEPSRVYKKVLVNLTLSGYGDVSVALDYFSQVEGLCSMSINVLKNETLTVTEAVGGYKLTARRFGHGVGMSQRGAQQMANEGFSYDQILEFYYPGLTRTRYTMTRTLLDSMDGTPAAPSTPDEPIADAKPAVVTLKNPLDSLNLRQRPTTASSILARMPHGTQINLLSREGEWSRVQYGTLTGYVMTSYLIVQEDSVDETPPGVVSRGTATVALSDESQTLNLRAAPTTNAAVLSRLRHGQTLTVLERYANWTYVQYGTLSGYVMNDYVVYDAGDSDSDAPNGDENGGEDSGENGGGQAAAQVAIVLPSDGLNLRAGANTASGVIMVLPQGTMLTVTGEMRDNGMLPVLLGSVAGYVSSDYVYVTDEALATATPAISATPTPAPTQPPVQAPEQDEREATVRAYGGLKLRQQPDTSSATLTTMPYGSVVTVTGERVSGFYPVRIGTLSGYVSADYIRFDVDAAATPAPTATPAPSASGYRVVVESDNGLNLRAQPNAGSEVLYVLPYGMVLTVLGEGENGFLYVQWGGYTGYVSGDYVTPFGAQ